MGYDPESIEGLVERAVGRREDLDPAFYAVTGSHVYGFPSDSASDVDARGFHVADGRRYALLDPPAEQVVVNQDGVTEGFEAFADVDLVSYELREFAALVADSNFNALELVSCGETVVDEVPEEIADLRALVVEYLPLDIPASYYGMARTNYQRSIAPEGEAATAKTFLYVLRGLLAAQYVIDEGTIAADVRTLADEVLGTTELIDELVAVKRAAGDARVPGHLAERATEQIEVMFDEVEVPDDGSLRAEKAAFRAAVDEWMCEVRGWSPGDISSGRAD